MFMYLYVEFMRGRMISVRMHETYKGANKRLLKARREYLADGWKLVSDEKKPDEYRYLKFSKLREDGMYDYAYANFSYERVED